ncbi:hypothetical protein QWY86_07400 [Pedobacter aquatilis]|uniref:hypothetical protein n=1 Tax=Pedobacter aquatilis TaxID=351343 RepID=UPI0025B5C48D|nr:hypothetical protein [Pedobacter aquatilis]MDN3586483.1 hypothetical protein [Pedobacter aquatilis]
MSAEDYANQQPKNLINIITFNVGATKTIGDDGIIPWINIARANEEILNLIDAEEVVIDEKEVTIALDYPLQNPESFSLESATGFTRTQLLIAIREKFLEFSKVQNVDITKIDLVSLDVYKTESGKIEITLEIDV